jgi:carboxymethylenebutenolidase
VPDLFHRGPACFSFEELDTRRRTFSDSQVIGDVNAAFAHLQGLPFVQGERLAIMGFCMGGRVSYLMATQRPDLRATADFYGGGVHAGEGGPSPLEMTANIRCPVIIFDGELDEHPSPDEVRKTGAELERYGKVHEIHIYPEVGHAFMSAQGPRRRAEAVDDAWERLLGWFDRHLVPEPVGAR